MARVLFAILLGGVVAACAEWAPEPTTEPTTEPETIGWAGVISGGGCDSYGIEITIDENGGIVGKATPHAAWNVSGIVISGSVDMLIESQPQGFVPPVTLVGRFIGSSISISEPLSVDCVPVRSGILERGTLPTAQPQSTPP